MQEHVTRILPVSLFPKIAEDEANSRGSLKVSELKKMPKSGHLSCHEKPTGSSLVQISKALSDLLKYWLSSWILDSDFPPGSAVPYRTWYRSAAFKVSPKSTLWY